MRTPGTEAVLDAASRWRDRCLVERRSVFTDRALWTPENVDQLFQHFVQNPDVGGRTFMAKLRDQLAPTTAPAKQLAAEMLWVLLLFPSNLRNQTKTQIVSEVWSWSGESLPANHPMFVAQSDGVGSGGMGFNNYRPQELEFLIAFLRGWQALPPAKQAELLKNPWEFAEFLDTVDGSERRQFRHMLLHLLFADTFERVASKSDKDSIEDAFRPLLEGVPLDANEAGTSLIARDRRLLRIRKLLEAQYPDAVVDYYLRPVKDLWRRPETPTQIEPAEPGPAPGPPHPDPHPPMPMAIDEIGGALRDEGMKISDRLLRRYHLALHSRGFVILSGISGTGKTWLAEEYAKAAGARYLVVPVAPNWTTNEDLLGFTDPFTAKYRDTAFSSFLREAAAEQEEARRSGRSARDFHLILDEMNLARVEYYFALFLSKMEIRMRDGSAKIDLGSESVVLGKNLRFVGTVNVDETTHGFADKVYDRAQVIEMELARSDLELHLGAAPYAGFMLEVWDAVRDVAPFAFRVVDDIGSYFTQAPADAEWQDLIDELLLQKVLPKVRGTDPRVGDALGRLLGLTEAEYPLSHAKVRTMKAGFDQLGVASYF